MQNPPYKCFITKVIDNSKRRLLHQIVRVRFCPNLLVWDVILHTDELWKVSSLQSKQAFMLRSNLRSNSVYSSKVPKVFFVPF